MSLSDGTKTIIRIDEHNCKCMLCGYQSISLKENAVHYVSSHKMQEHSRTLEYTRNTVTGYSQTIYLISKDYLTAQNYNDNYDRAMKGID